MYSSRSSKFIGSSFFFISWYFLSISFIGIILLALNLNKMFWYCILYFFGHFVNHIISLFQLASNRLCLTNQLYSKNMSMQFKFITTTSIFSIYLLVSSSNSANWVTLWFLLLVLAVLKVLNSLGSGVILIYSFFTSCLSI